MAREISPVRLAFVESPIHRSAIFLKRLYNILGKKILAERLMQKFTTIPRMTAFEVKTDH
jgi:hypothetical protein